MYINTNVLFEHDQFSDLNLRTTAGAGPGYQFIENERTELSAEAGINYVIEDYDESEDREYFAGRWAVDFSSWLYKKYIQAFHSHFGLWSLEDTSDILVESETGLRFPLAKGFQLTAKYELDWKNKPPEGSEKFEQRYILTIGYSFDWKE